MIHWAISKGRKFSTKNSNGSGHYKEADGPARRLAASTRRSISAG